MNETTIQSILQAIYECCEKIENHLDDIRNAYLADLINEDEYYYFTDLYDDLFNKTNEIEEQYELLESEGK